MCFLVGQLPDGRSFRHELAPGRTTVGRFALSTIRLEEESISPLHAELISLHHPRYLVRDLHSQYGIAVDGREVFEEEITAPCRLTFGRFTCELLLEAPAPVIEQRKSKPGRTAPSISKGPSPRKLPSLPTPGTIVSRGHHPGVAFPPRPSGKAPTLPESLQITLPKSRRGRAASTAAHSRKGPPQGDLVPLPPRETVPPSSSVARAPSALPFPSPARFLRRRSWANSRRLVALATIVLFLGAAVLYMGSQRSPAGKSSAATTSPGHSREPGASFLARMPTPPMVVPTPEGRIGVSLPAAEPAETKTASVALPPAKSDPPSAPGQAVVPPVDAPAPVAAAVVESANPLQPSELPVAPSLIDLSGASLAMKTPNQEAQVTPLAENSAPEGALAISPASVANTTQQVALPDEARLVAPAPWADLKPKADAPADSGVATTPSVENASATPPSRERASWGFAAEAKAQPRWDASAGTLLAANAWQLGARELDKPEVISTDAPIVGTPWQFGAGQQHIAGLSGDLASLFTRPSGTTPKPPAPTLPPEKLSIMILGDSLALCGFGSRLDRRFRETPEVRATNTYMACGTVPMSWLKEGAYGNLKTYCGFWTIESPSAPSKKPQSFQDTYGMGHGKPKAYPVPKLEDLLTKAQPDVLVIQTGTNLFSLFLDRQTVQPDRHAAMLRSQIHPFLAKILKSPHPPRAIYWVGSPLSGRVSIPVQEFVLEQVRAQVGQMVTVIDSRKLVTYPYRHMEPDHEHFTGADMEVWADGVYNLIEKDLQQKPLPLALTPAPGLEKDGRLVGKEPVARPAENDDSIRVTATLVRKSTPFDPRVNTYSESMISCIYDVQKVESGIYTESKIMVMQPAMIAYKNVAATSKLKVGNTYRLHVHELSDSSPWYTIKKKEDTGFIDLLPYIQMEDEARFPSRAP